MRRPDVLDPAVAADLAALDDALAGAPDADPALALLAADVRSAAPRPAPGFRSTLDARVERGFPRPPRRPRAWRRLLVPAAPVVAVAAVLVLVVVLAPGSDNLGSRVGGGGGGSASSTAASKAGAGDAAGRVSGGGGEASPSVGSAAGSGSIAPPPPTQPSPGRRVERDVRLALRAPAARFDEVSDGIVRTTQSAGGFVASSQISSAQAGGTASFVLQVPADRLDSAVAALSRLGHVTRLEQSTQDVTDTFDSLERQVSDAQIERRSLIAALATATGTPAIRLRARLDRVTARLRLLLQQRRDLAARTNYGTVELSLTATRRGGAAPPPGGRWTPGDAWHDAQRVLEVAAGVVIVVLAVLVPLALMGGAVALGAGVVRRRRREAALGEA